MAYNPRDPKQNWLPGYLRTVADRFGLKDWEIEILETSPEDDKSAMCVWCPTGRRLAQVQVDDFFWTRESKKQRGYVVHELVHCHLWPMADYAESCINANEKDALRRFEELSVDGIAQAVAPFMPLPSKSVKKTKKT